MASDCGCARDDSMKAALYARARHKREAFRYHTSSCKRWSWDCHGNGSMNAQRSACCEKKSAAKYVDITVNMAGLMSMELPREWTQMDAEKLRNLTATLISQLAERDAR